MQLTCRTMVYACLIAMACMVSPLRAAEDEVAGGEQEMRPTRLGLQMTPRIARGFARHWLVEVFDSDSGLADEQRSRIADAAARRIMDANRQHGQAGQAFFENLCESMLLYHGRYTPELAAELAKHADPMIPVFRQLFQDVADDARPMLDPGQLEHLQAEIEKQTRMLDQFEAKMKRWAKGEMEDGEDIEDLFDDLEPPETDDTTDEGETDEETKQRREALKRAKRSAGWEMRRFGPKEWARFLFGAQYFFQFDEEQIAKGKALLDDYRGRAKEIMTEEWKRRVRRNRIQYHLRWRIRELANGPWMYHLEREYERDAAQIREMGHEFRKEVLALATDEQREAALAKIREQVERHGMTLEPMDEAILGLKLE